MIHCIRFSSFYCYIFIFKLHFCCVYFKFSHTFF